MENAYGDEVINHQNSSNFNMENDDDGLDQLHDQLKNLDGEDDQPRFNERNSRQIIDEQNLDMNNIKHQEEEEDEGQHYPDDDDDDVDEDLEQLEELEAQMQQQQMLNMPNEEMDYDDIDPELREAAERMGLDEEGVRALQQ